ncbi:MAG: hypothetical protein QOJ64_461 [Acidobacteriota bacterium]|nr:hypothetical protein [Acidobacteriota bacterium]
MSRQNPPAYAGFRFNAGSVRSAPRRKETRQHFQCRFSVSPTLYPGHCRGLEFADAFGVRGCPFPNSLQFLLKYLPQSVFSRCSHNSTKSDAQD